jgi:CheY-like chemotaxis protein
VYTHVVDPSKNRTDQVMVIDDDAILRELLSLLLGAEGHTVFTAECGEDAMALLSKLTAEQLPTVILADLKMPGVSPTALAVQLRVACPDPAVLLAMSASEPGPGEAAAFDGFLPKPFSVADYDAAVELARTQVDGFQIAARADAPVDDDPGHRPPALDEAIYAKLFSVMGTTQLPQLYTLFLEDAAMRVARMRTAVTGNDIGTFTREAHAIKGGCGMLGATELYSLASHMETGGFSCSTLLDDFGPGFERLRRILEQRMNRQVGERNEPNT